MQTDQLNKPKILRNNRNRFSCNRIVDYTKCMLAKGNFPKTACLVAAVLMSQFSIARSSNKDVTIEKKKIVVKKIDAKYKKDMIQQVVTVRGLVTDAENSPMAGVSVLVKGSSVATATNQDGRYEIELNKGQTLLFRMIGYADVEFVI